MLLLSLQGSVSREDLFKQYAVRPANDAQAAPGKFLRGEPIIIARTGVYVADESRDEFFARVRTAAKGKKTFAGDYAIVGWSCGAGCVGSAIVSARDGRVTLVPFSAAMCRGQEVGQLEFREGSRLLVVHGGLEWHARPGESPSDWECGEYFFEWDGESLRRVQPGKGRH
jgi:hypothetical protein